MPGVRVATQDYNQARRDGRDNPRHILQRGSEAVKQRARARRGGPSGLAMRTLSPPRGFNIHCSLRLFACALRCQHVHLQHVHVQHVHVHVHVHARRGSNRLWIRARLWFISMKFGKQLLFPRFPNPLASTC